MRATGERRWGGQEGSDPRGRAESGEAECPGGCGARKGDFAEGAGHEAPVPALGDRRFVRPALQREVKPGGQRSQGWHERCGELRDKEVAVVAVTAMGVLVGKHDRSLFRFEQLKHASRDQDVTGPTRQRERERIIVVSDLDRSGNVASEATM